MRAVFLKQCQCQKAISRLLIKHLTKDLNLWSEEGEPDKVTHFSSYQITEDASSKF